MLAVLSPGQGSQKPGFLTPWLDLTGTEARLRWWSALAGIDLVHLGTAADADEIKDTARTQPLLVAASLLAAAHLPMHDVGLVAGHSVGELAAAALAGVIPAETAIALAGVRGREMAAACAVEPTGMAAVLGGDADEVLAVIEKHGLHPANRNATGQVVAAGSVEGIDKLAAEPPTGARIMRLKVAGAFHTPYMAPAEAALAAVAGGIATRDPDRVLLSNLDGTAVTHGREMVQRLVRQVTAPVRWDLCMAGLAALGVTGVIELAPAGTLTNLVKREFKGSDALPELVTLNTPDDLPAARDLVARHGAAPDREPTSGIRVVVARVPGTFEPVAGLGEGETVEAGQTIGHVSTRQGPVEVTVQHGGLLTQWLAHHDDPVAPGQPLARIGGHQP